MGKKGLPLPVVAISLSPALGDAFVSLNPPFHEPAASGDSPMPTARTSLSFHTPTDLLAESQWLTRNRKYWDRYAIAKPPLDLPLPPGYRTAHDGLTLEEILSGDLTTESSTAAQAPPRSAPHRAAALLLEACQLGDGEAPFDLDGPEVDAAVRSVCEATSIRVETSELDIALALLESSDSLPVGLLVFVSRALARAGWLERAATLLKPAGDADARILAGDIAESRAKRTEARENVAAAIARDIGVLGGVERMERWRRATLGPGARPNIAITLDGVLWRICFRACAVLGRADADIVVPAPTVSRRQVEFFSMGGVPQLADAHSKHGTVVNGSLLRGPLAIKSRVDLRFGGAVSCVVRPVGMGQLVVEAPTGIHLLAMGPVARLEAWTFVRSARKLSVSKPGSTIRRRGDESWQELVEVRPGDIFESRDGSELAAHPESFDS